MSTENSLVKLYGTPETKETHLFVNSQKGAYRRNDSTRPVSFLLEPEVNALADVAGCMRDGQRNALMLLCLFQCCLRISECLQLTLKRRIIIQGRPVLTVVGKGNKPRLVAMPAALSDKFGNYVLSAGLGPEDRLFGISRVRAWQIIKGCAKASGLENRRIYLHLLRHAGAVSRLRKTGNIQSLKTYLGHTDHKMTERYLVTLQIAESLAIEGAVEFER
jgi:site-specific recombinase XerD